MKKLQQDLVFDMCSSWVQVVAEDVVVATKNGSSIGIAFVEFKHYQDAERMQVRMTLVSFVCTVSAQFTSSSQRCMRD
jgi:hypothetical protein